MSDLLGVEVNTINYHLKEIFKTRELEEDAVIREIRTSAPGSQTDTNEDDRLDSEVTCLPYIQRVLNMAGST